MTDLVQTQSTSVGSSMEVTEIDLCSQVLEEEGKHTQGAKQKVPKTSKWGFSS